MKGEKKETFGIIYFFYFWDIEGEYSNLEKGKKMKRGSKKALFLSRQGFLNFVAWMYGQGIGRGELDSYSWPSKM